MNIYLRVKSVGSSLNSQRIDMVEGDEQANLKAGDASIDRGRQSVTGANQNVCYFLEK